jgi:hypothetical protein
MSLYETRQLTSGKWEVTSPDWPEVYFIRDTEKEAEAAAIREMARLEREKNKK